MFINISLLVYLYNNNYLYTTKKNMDEYKIFKALGEKTRYSIVLKLLKEKDNCCTDLASFTGKDLSTISRQLVILEKEGIISIEKINKSKCVKIRNKKLLLKIIDDIKKIKGDKI